jgi:hypothetical protein
MYLAMLPQGKGMTQRGVYELMRRESQEWVDYGGNGGYPWFGQRCYASVQIKECEYDVIGIEDDICDIEDVTIFALDTVKIFVGAEGNNKAVARLYALENYGIIHDAVCIQPCGPEGYQWALEVSYLDTVNAGTDGIFGTLDDFADNFEIEYGDEGGQDYFDPVLPGTFVPNYYSQLPNDDWPDPVEVPPTTEPTPDFRDGTTEVFIALKLMNLVDIRVCGSSQTIPLCCWDMPQCGVDDYWVNTGDAPVYVELTIDDSDDLGHTDLIVDGGFTVTHYSGEEVTTEIVKVDIDPMSIVVNDDEVTDTMKATSNLVLVGGPGLVVCVGAAPQVANTLTQDLVDQGLSAVDWQRLSVSTSTSLTPLRKAKMS